jgi:D-alanine-D-alanine ligase
VKKIIGLVHNEPVPEGQVNWESSVDIMVQVEAIERSLVSLGHEAVRLPFTRDLGRFVNQTKEAALSMAFNLCESVDDNPAFIAHPAAVMELLDIPFTGSPAAAILSTTDKHLVKLALRAAGLNTPEFLLFSGEETISCGHMRFPVILKPRFQDASIGIDQESVVADSLQLLETLPEFYGKYGPIIVEQYLAGREFNISMLGSMNPQVLPAAEIDFSGLPDSLFKIVGYRAKWEPDSLEYQQTKRLFPALSGHLAAEMSAVSTTCYNLFGLRDYGRVDLRLDEAGRIYVLEINANPCLSPDAGFAAAVQESGLSYTAMVDKLISFVLARSI